jgi:putative two-component system response regulator
MDVMRRHAEYGKAIVLPLAERERAAEAEQAAGPALATGTAAFPRSPLLMMAARIAMSHHERWDGAGYPEGLAEEQIPLEARITAVADVFDALSTARCYKPAFPLVKCFEIVAAERGRHFDPDIADICLSRSDDFESVYYQMADQDAPA